MEKQVRKSFQEALFVARELKSHDFEAFRVRHRRQGRYFAMVLQDPCPRDVAEQVLLAGVDFETHCNPAPGPILRPKAPSPLRNEAEIALKSLFCR